VRERSPAKIIRWNFWMEKEKREGWELQKGQGRVEICVCIGDMGVYVLLSSLLHALKLK
jgi:hypothetical protein